MSVIPRPCRLEGCTRDAAPNKLICRMHRSRMARSGSYGPPEAYRRLAPDELLASRSTRSGECLRWDGCANNVGYGHVSINGRHWFVHRLAYEIHVAPIPPGLNVLHSCDTPRCIEPTHLRVGTQADNAQDVVLRHRHARHLAPDRVAELYGRFADGESDKAISHAMGLPRGTVAARRHKWRKAA